MDIGLSSPTPTVRASLPVPRVGSSMPRPAVGPRPGTGTRMTIAEGALVLIVAYALLGAGVGAIFGSALPGLLAGAALGVCAVGAILLVTGSALSAERSGRSASARR